MKKILISGAIVLASLFSGSNTFASDVSVDQTLVTIENSVVVEDERVGYTYLGYASDVEDERVGDILVGYISDVVENVKDFLIPSTDASFMGDIASQIGSGATAETAVVIGGPIGSIIFYVLAIFLIGFVVTTVTMWVRHRKA